MTFRNIPGKSGSSESEAVIAIKQIQNVDGSEDTLSFITDGLYSADENMFRLSYEETDVTGLPGTTTSVSFYPDRIIVDRSGSINSSMEFMEGANNFFSYRTPYGTAEIYVNTRSIRQNFDSSGGNAEISYSLNLHSRRISNNKFIISVKQQENGYYAR